MSDTRRRDDMDPLHRAVSDTLDEYLTRLHGVITSHTSPDSFLEWLGEQGHIVVPKPALLQPRPMTDAEVDDFARRWRDTVGAHPFAEYVGHRAEFTGPDGVTVTGNVLAASNGRILVHDGQGEVELPLELIDQARAVPESASRDAQEPQETARTDSATRDEPDYVTGYRNFWQDIVEHPDGTLNHDQLMRELHDYHDLMNEVGIAYCGVTNDRISKPNTAAHHIIGAVEERIEEACAEAVKEARQEIADLRGQLDTATTIAARYHRMAENWRAEHQQSGDQT